MQRASDLPADACLDEDMLAAYVDGVLAAEDVAVTERHIDRCRSCREELSALASVTFPSGDPAAPDVDIEKFPIVEGTLGRYRIEQELGRGAMGVVMRAFDPELARAVAIKVLTDGWSQGSNTREHLRREAQAMARLSHPNVVQIYDVMVEDDLLAIAMELVEGTTLRDAIDAAAMSWTQLLEICVKAGRGLAAAHAAKLVHRDFKPENVLCAADGRVLVSDFGLARADEVTTLPRDGSVTKTSFAGTPAYAAPEIVDGASATAQSDQFSFCVTTYEALYGERPFAGTTLDEMRAAMGRGEVRAPSRPVSSAVRQALLRGLSNDARARFPSMEALLDALAPTPRHTSRVAFAAGAGVLAIGAVVAAFALRPTTFSCEPTSLGWDRPTLERALRSEPDGAHVIARVERYARAWEQTRQQACEATHVHKELSERVLDARNACLDRGRSELLDLTAMLAREPSLAARAVDAIGALPDPQGCTADVTTRPRDPALDHANVLMAAGRTQEVLDATEPIVARAAVPPALLAETLLLRGRAEAHLARYDASEQTLTKALTLAEQAGANQLVAWIWIELVHLTGADDHRFDAARANMRGAEAAFARADPGSAVRAAYQTTVGSVLAAQGELDDARTHLERALASYQPSQIDELGPIHEQLCDVYNQLGETDKARAHCKSAVDMLTTTYGADHEQVAAALTAWGTVEFGAEQRDAAREKWSRVIAILEHRKLESDRNLALALSNIGATWNQQGEIEKARPYFERARALFAKYHPDHVQRTIPLSGLASIALTSGDYRGAIAAYEEALGVIEHAYGKEDARRLTILFNVAVAYAHLPDYDKATALSDEIISICTHPGQENWLLTAYALDLQASLAEDRSKDWARSSELRGRALTALAHSDDPFLHAWLEVGLGHSLRQAHQVAKSLPPLEHAVTYFAAHRDNPYYAGTSELLLARSLWDTGNHARAITLANAAKADLDEAKTGDTLEQDRKDATAWLASHH